MPDQSSCTCDSARCSLDSNADSKKLKLPPSMKPTTSTNQSRSLARILPQLGLWLAVLFVPLVLAVALKIALAASSEQIKPTGALNVPRAGHTATLLTNGDYAGRVLIAGGVDASGNATA